jgi:L-2-hydroxyglutarate oxidase LhgO
LPQLERILERGRANGIEGLEALDGRGIREREPYCRGLMAIWSPITGIVDWGQVARAYGDDVRAGGGEILTGRKVKALHRRHSRTIVEAGAEPVEARHVITCGGLYSDRLARMTGRPNHPKIVPFRGDYLMLKPDKRDLFTTNIYPVPDPALPFLGVHFTPRMDGERWLGPNAVLAFSREGYSFGRVNGRDLAEMLTYQGFQRLMRRHWRTGAGELYRGLVKSAYVRALQRYIPELNADDCLPGPSGVRAQAVERDGSLVDDFVIESGEGAMHVRNAPSPAATASLAIGRVVCEEAARRFALGVPLKS